MDSSGSWFQFGLLSFGSDLEFDTPPSPTTLNTPQNLPPSCEVASLDQAPSFSSAGTPGVVPSLPFHHPMSGDPLPTFAWPPPSLATQPTTPGLTNTRSDSSPVSFVSPDPYLQGSPPTPVAQQTNRVAKRPRKHLCVHAGCGYSCALPKDLRKHTLTHFPPTIKCPNSDNGCPQIFRRDDQCLRHVASSCRYRPPPYRPRPLGS